MRKKFIDLIPFYVFFIVYLISSLWLSDQFIALGLSKKDTTLLQIVVIVTFLIGYLTAELRVHLRSK